MRHIRFDGIADDTKIQSIGPLFWKDNGRYWGVNLGLTPTQNKSSLTLSHAPVLARRRVLNASTDTRAAGYLRSFTIESTQDWLRNKLGEYPVPGQVRSAEAIEWGFCFLDGNGIQIFLPQFELARALFFHDTYWSRAALASDGLRAEFDVQKHDRELARINVLPSASYPVHFLNDYGCRRLMSWLLLDEDAKISFNSIGRYQKLYGYDKNHYRYWHFQFDPPKLPGAKFEVRGHYDKELQCMFVYEITSIRNIKADIPKVVEIYHPNFTENVSGQGEGGARSLPANPSEHTVHGCGRQCKGPNGRVIGTTRNI